MTEHLASVQKEPSEWVPAIRKKKATVLRLEMLDMIKLYGRNSVVTFTLTFQKFISRAEAHKRWHSLCTNLIAKLFRCGMWVIERSPATGRLHFHGGAVLTGSQDVRTGFDFEAYHVWKEADQKGSGVSLGRKKALFRNCSRHVTPDLRGLWKDMDPAVMKRYGFGHSHLIPIEKNGEAFAIYMAKYLSKPAGSDAQYLTEDKGHRSYGIWGKRRAASVFHSANTKRASAWRRRVAFTAEILGEVALGRPFTHDEFSQYCGPRWCFFFKPWMSDIPLSYIHNRERFGHKLIKEKLHDFPHMGKGLRAEDSLISTFLDFFNGEGRRVGSEFKAKPQGEPLKEDLNFLPGIVSPGADAGLLKAGRARVH